MKVYCVLCEWYWSRDHEGYGDKCIRPEDRTVDYVTGTYGYSNFDKNNNGNCQHYTPRLSFWQRIRQWWAGRRAKQKREGRTMKWILSLICLFKDHEPRHFYEVSPFLPTRCECSRCGKALPLYYGNEEDDAQ